MTDSRRNFLKKSSLALAGATILPNHFFLIDFKEKKAKIYDINELKKNFLDPPDSAKPGVYWYFMDGNMSKEGMTKDLRSMKEAGIGRLVFLEVNVGVPRGPVDYLSEEWLDFFKHAVDEAEQLGIEITLGVGPGWTGSGGPWIAPEQSMQHLVASSITISGTHSSAIKLPLPDPKAPYFGEGQFTDKLEKQWQDYYKDIAVLAFPANDNNYKISDIDEKALYYRAPFSSRPNVKPFLPTPKAYASLAADSVVNKEQIIDLTDHLKSDGTLDWQVPEGKWTIMRFVARNNGAITRPAPMQGLGFECDKFNPAALKTHLDAYVETIFSTIGKIDPKVAGGLKMLHMDSWEMGAQNWTGNFRQAFKEKRGYDPLPYYPVYAGTVVGSLEMSERFLWDLRQTCKELVFENHVSYLKKYSHEHKLRLSIEPYDMNPTSDLELGAMADIPMSEFWSKGYGYNTAFSVIEATSIAHINGSPIAQSEAFTSDNNEAWKQYPGSMKNQGDWAFAAGINRFFYHTFEHKPWDDKLKPGMTMGPYGVHWDRKQTWWPMVADYHGYVSRCQLLLQQGRTVADILYLAAEAAPQVFLPTDSALSDDELLPDRKGYNFDACSPLQFYNASVKDGKITFPSGAEYAVLILPATPAMTMKLLEKIASLVKAGATVIGTPPERSHGLTDYPDCDNKIKSLVKELWGASPDLTKKTTRHYGKGKIVFGDEFNIDDATKLYPDYDGTAALLKATGLKEDFTTSSPIRYTHRTSPDYDIYFVSNKADKSIKASCGFLVANSNAELWDPLSGEIRALPEIENEAGLTTIPLEFEAYQSYFIIFPKNKTGAKSFNKNFPKVKKIATLAGAWEINFDQQWGGPEKVIFDHLEDWTKRPEKGINYYSGIATYHKTFDFSFEKSGNELRYYLDLGEVKKLARVWLNGKNLGTVWTAPWRADITSALKQGSNDLKIEVANLWPNRLIGDEQYPDDGIKDGKFPDWLIKGEKRQSKRYTFTTFHPYKKGDPLLSSGLLGPVTIKTAAYL